MRNLKKILALVLALVMSLSLMATASAADFADVSDDNPYKVAIDVLEGLKVFQGYQEDGTFRPEASLTRAQAAALVYRIATGDAEDQYVANYTDMAQSKFTDLDGYNWARGYINYCQNAEIVKGKNAANTIFDPGATVSGYQLMAMVLRTMGYGKNGEFEGNGWELQTAAKAESIGILKGVTSGDYGAPAPRQMVAQILFNALLTSKVDYTTLLSYQPNGHTLGGDQFGLEQVTGIILSNQWASLTGNKVEDENVTKLEVTEVQEIDATSKVGDTLTLSYATDLDAVGLRHTAYIANKTGAKKVLTIADDGLNTVAYNEGKGVNNSGKGNQEWPSVEKLADTKGLKLDDTADKTEYFINYAKAWEDYATSKYIIRYRVNEKGLKDAVDYGFITASTKADYIKYITGLNTASYKPVEVVSGTAAAGDRVWIVTIQPERDITVDDQAIMKDIFYTANRYAINPDQNIARYEIGEVYVGTTMTKDYSDTMSWPDFTAEYFTADKNFKKITKCEIGNSLRIVDNDLDGVADYVLKIEYTQDKVVGNYKNDLLLNSLALSDYPEGNLRYSPEADKIAQGTVVNYTVIDKKLSIWPAEIVTDTVNTKNFQKVTVTLAGGDEKGQSGIDNETKMDEDIMQMAQATQYNMYLDEYGYVRSYELAQGHKYALLTEMYPGVNKNGNYVQSNILTAEVKIADADVVEKVVKNSPFFNRYTWTYGLRGWTGIGVTGGVISNAPTNNPNYLQPAVAHLGIDGSFMGEPNVFTGKTNNLVKSIETAWARAVTDMELRAAYDAATGGPAGVFNYGDTAADKAFSFTNVASYIETGDTLTLSSASKLYADRATGAQVFRLGSDMGGVKQFTHGTKAELMAKFMEANSANEIAAEAWFAAGRAIKNGTGIYPVYAEDYVQLDLTKSDAGVALNPTDLVVKPGIRHFHIDKEYNNYYNTNANTYVDATTETEFYIVVPGGEKDILYKVGYADLPSIRVEEIRAAYAVAHNTRADVDGQDYWVADVVVIETSRLDYDYESISLAYYNPYETSGYIRYADTLNNQWKALQPDNGKFAQLGIVPKAGMSDISWGNATWSASTLGFYRLYRTAMDEAGNLTVGDAKKITEKFNDYGIYAGTVTRIEELVGSQYVDVNTTKTGFVQDHAIDIKFGSSDEVPFYRVYTELSNTYAKKLDLNNVLHRSDVHNGDSLIWVYNQAKNELAFVVDVTERDDNGDGKMDWTVPAWLKTLYQDILDSQAPVSDGTIPVTIQTSGLPQEKSVTKYVANGGLLTLTEEELLKLAPTDDNYVLDAPELTSTGVAGITVNTAVGSVGSRYWTISGTTPTAGIVAPATGAYVITVKYAKAPATLTAHITAGAPAVTLVTGGDATTAQIFADAATVTNVSGTTYKVYFQPAANKSYEVKLGTEILTGTHEVIGGNNCLSYSFTVKKNSDLHITETNDKSLSVGVSVTNGAGTAADVKFNAPNTGLTDNVGGNVYGNAAVNFTVEAKSGYSVTGVGYQLLGESVQALGTTAGNYSLPANVTNGSLPVTIVVNTLSTASATVTTNVVGTVTSLVVSRDNGATWEPVTNGGTVNNVVPGTTLTFKANTPFVTGSDPTAAATTANVAVTGNMTVTLTQVCTLSITNQIVTGGTLTAAVGANPAAPVVGGTASLQVLSGTNVVFGTQSATASITVTDGTTTTSGVTVNWGPVTADGNLTISDTTTP